MHPLHKIDRMSSVLFVVVLCRCSVADAAVCLLTTYTGFSLIRKRVVL